MQFNQNIIRRYYIINKYYKTFEFRKRKFNLKIKHLNQKYLVELILIFQLKKIINFKF